MREVSRLPRNTFEEDESLRLKFGKKEILKSAHYIGRYKWRMLLALLLSALSSVIALTGPLIMKHAVDVNIPAGDVKGVIWLSVLLAGTVAVSTVLNMVRGKMIARVGQDVVHNIRHDIFEKLQLLPFSYYDSRPQGKILIRVIHYVNSVADMLSNGIVNILVELLNILFIIGFMFVVDARLALVILIGVPIFAVVIFIIKPAQRRAWQGVSNKTSNINAFVQEAVEGVSVTQIFGRQQENRKVMERLTVAARKTWFKAIYVTNMVWFSVETISQIAFSLVFIAGILWINPPVLFGTVLAMGTYSQNLWKPITNLANLYNNFINAIAYLERVYETIDEPVTVQDRPGAKALPPVKGAVEFRHVSFEYEPGQRILKDVSFTARPGESIALVGPTGAGKSTVINLLSRFYNIDMGQVLIDGRDIMDVTLPSLRSQMGIMMQDSFIFSGTIADNIRYGKLDASDWEVEQAARTVCAHDFISHLKRGYETEVGARGGGLSQGQRQLISFARTVIADPRVLILDEATSSIDTETERLVQEGLSRLLEGRTSFIVAHRLSTIRHCDRILYIKDGEIAESGSHEELMAKQGLYYHLYTAQLIQKES